MTCNQGSGAHAGEKPNNHAAQKIRITATPANVPFRRHKAVQKFRWRVRRISSNWICLVRWIESITRRSTQISYFGFILKHKDIRWLQILMSNMFAVQLAQPCGNMMKANNFQTNVKSIAKGYLMTNVAIRPF